MTREDVDRLFELLAIYRPGDVHLRDKRLRSAWLLVLEPFTPEDVKKAVAAYFREKKFWPDVTDIATRCDGGKNRLRASIESQYQPSEERIRANAEWLDRFLNQQEPGWRNQLEANS